MGRQKEKIIFSAMNTLSLIFFFFSLPIFKLPPTLIKNQTQFSTEADPKLMIRKKRQAAGAERKRKKKRLRDESWNENECECSSPG
jgi:hypothetical protein